MPTSPNYSSKLLGQTRERLRAHDYSPRTEKSYMAWIKRFMAFYDQQQPINMGRTEVDAFLAYLMAEQKVSVETRNQACSAILFLYRQVLGANRAWLHDIGRLKSPKRAPMVLSFAEVMKLLAHMHGHFHLMAGLAYGSGLRLMEVVGLRVRDVDLERRKIVVHDDKGVENHVTFLPRMLVNDLQRQMDHVTKLHAQDSAAGYGMASLPDALATKYSNAAHELDWQYLFPSKSLSENIHSGEMYRCHLN